MQQLRFDRSALCFEGAKDERVVADAEVDNAARANQKRMNADPLEVMLLNMGYRLSGVLDQPSSDDGSGGAGGGSPASIRCTQS